MTDPYETRRKKLLFRAHHRGFKEADLVFGRYADARIAAMDAPALAAFEALLDAPDHDAYGWVMAQSPVPDGHDGALLADMRAFVAASGVAQ